MFSCTPCWKILRKSFSPSNRATSREEEKTPASNAPNAVALRRAPVPCIATTCPLLSMSIVQVALVSFINLVNTIEMVPSSRSEMTRFVSCSMDAPPSVYTPSMLCHPSLLSTLQTLGYIKSFQNFAATRFNQMAHTSNSRSIIRNGHHQGEVTQRVHAHQPMLVLHEHTHDAPPCNLLAQRLRCTQSSSHNGPHRLHVILPITGQPLNHKTIPSNQDSLSHTGDR